MVGIVAALMMLYASAYYAMIDVVFIESSSGAVWGPFLEYRFGAYWAYDFFKPMYLLDVKMRPEFWNTACSVIIEELPPP